MDSQADFQFKLMRRITVTVTLVGLLQACSGSNFQSAIGRPAASKKADVSPKEVVTTEKTNAEDSPVLEAKNSLELQQRCWFAVSGFPVLWGSAHIRFSEFGKTLSGNPIKHGEKFDNGGGIYLQASDIPYEYHSGNGEIDLAIDRSFDSIVVPPGMFVEIKNEDGGQVFKGQGPLIAYRMMVPSPKEMRRQMEASGYDVRILPDWFQNILSTETGSDKIRIEKLLSGRWVKVQAVPGTDCGSIQ